ncbi:response regulator [Zunongwangia sp.]|uniref:response regulator n=1 Tax=Zunongwangia sp. TaxID=1965325 RepID=UPI003AA9B8D0
MSKSIVIVDDHILFGQSLKEVINTYKEYEVLHLFKNGKELQDFLKKKLIVPDIVLLDVRMPILDGVATMEWLKSNFPSLKVLALTMASDENTLLKMLSYGCRGYLLKNIDLETLKIALDDVDKKGYYYNTLDVKENKENFKSDKSQLSNREKEFLKYVCTDLTYKEIANKMHLSPKTIDGYRESLFNKLNVKSRQGLAVYSVKHKFYDI